jgi:hypothetical protein
MIAILETERSELLPCGQLIKNSVAQAIFTVLVFFLRPAFNGFIPLLTTHLPSLRPRFYAPDGEPMAMRIV